MRHVLPLSLVLAYLRKLPISQEYLVGHVNIGEWLEAKRASLRQWDSRDISGLAEIAGVSCG
jgi:hypothetical protein